MSKPIRVFVSYSHDSPEHLDAVLRLANTLRGHGIDVELDRYVRGVPTGGWPLWMENSIEAADYVLIVCSKVSHTRWKAEQDTGGAGATWEAVLTRQDLYEARTNNKKYIPILMTGELAEAVVPKPLRSTTFYRIPDQYTPLYRHLTGQPEIERPSLGEMLVLAPGETITFEAPAQPDSTPEIPVDPTMVALRRADLRRTGQVAGQAWGLFRELAKAAGEDVTVQDINQAALKRMLANLGPNYEAPLIIGGNHKTGYIHGTWIDYMQYQVSRSRAFKVQADQFSDGRAPEHTLLLNEIDQCSFFDFLQHLVRGRPSNPTLSFMESVLWDYLESARKLKEYVDRASEALPSE